jgi:hypothetical protein
MCGASRQPLHLPCRSASILPALLDLILLLQYRLTPLSNWTASCRERRRTWKTWLSHGNLNVFLVVSRQLLREGLSLCLFLTRSLLAWQIWRTEAVSKHLEESGGGVLPLMAVVVATIAAVACGLGLYEHSSAIGDLLFATSPEGWAALLQGVPWAAIFWTALFSTDLLLLIEVCFLLPAAVAAKLLFFSS